MNKEQVLTAKREQYWRDLLGEELRDRLIALAHEDIAAVRAEARENRKRGKAKAAGV
jgi:hypothetical protein